VTLLLALGSLPSAVPIGVANAASLVSSSQTQVYSIQTRGLLFNGAGAGPNVTVTSKFHPTGVVNWFNSLGGNITMTPPLATAVVQFNATVFAYVATGIISGAIVTASTYFIKQAGTPSNMKVVIVGTSNAAVNYTLSFTNVNGATVTQPDSCTLMLGTVGFSWCDVQGMPVYFDPSTLVLKFTLPLGAFTIDPVTIGTSSLTSATRDDAQSKVFFCQTRYWAFYSDGGNIVWRTSTDGTSWSSATTVRAGTNGYYFSVWVDCANTKLYYAFANVATTFQHRAGTLNTDGTITWDYAEVSVTSTRPNAQDPTITKSSDSKLYIAFGSVKTAGGSTGGYVEVWVCTISGTNCGTASNWASSTNFRVNTNTGTTQQLDPVISPLTSTKLSLVYAKSTSAAQSGIKTFTGSAWNAEVLTTSNYQPTEYTALAISDTTHFAGVKSDGTVIYWSCAYSCSSAPTETTLSGVTTNNNAGISSDGAQQLVASYGTSGSSTSILYKVSDDGGSSWGSEQTLASSESLAPASLTISGKGNNNYQFLWTSNSCTCNVRFVAALNAFTTSLSETPPLSDSMSKGVGKFPSETPPLSGTTASSFQGFRSESENPSLSGVSNKAFAGSRALSEDIASALSDAVIRIFTGFRGISEDLSAISASISKDAGKFSIESLVAALTDTVGKAAGKFASETISLSDLLSRIFTGAHGVPEDLTSTIFDSASRNFTGFRGTSESLGSAITDMIGKGVGKFAAETLSPSDVLGRLFTGFRVMPEDLTSSVSDSISKSAGKFLSEAPPFSDVVDRIFTGFRGLTDSPTVSDSIARLFTGFRALTETSTVSDAVSRLFTGFRVMPENLVSSVSDSISKSAGKFLSEAPPLSDVVDRLFTGFRALTETPTVSDALSRVFTGFRFLAESPAISDSLARVFTGFRALTESPTISDALSRLFTGFRALTETPTASDAVARLFTGFRSLVESPTVSDALSRVFTGFRALTESPTVSDALGRVFTAYRALSETPTVSDVVARVFTGFRSLSESLAGMTDSITKSAGKFLSEAPPLSDATGRLFTGFKALTETPTVSDALGRVFTGFRALTESPTVSDSVARVFTGFRATSEDLASSISDSISKSAGKFLSEAPPLSDVASRIFTGLRGLTESPTISDSLSRIFSGSRALTEDISATLSDMADRAHVIIVADTSLFSDSVSKAMKSTRNVLDTFSFATAFFAFASLARRVTDSFPFSDTVPFSHNLLNSFQVLVTDSYAYSEIAARTAHDILETIVALIDSFAFGDQTGSGGVSNSPGFFGDLANRVVAGLKGLTGSLTGPAGSSSGPAGTLTALGLTLGLIAALAAMVAIFVRRRKGRSGCNVITMAAPPCPKYGGKHMCGGRSTHGEAHKCKCGASW